MGQRLEVLLVEDHEDDAILIARSLSRGGYEPNIKRVETEAAMREALASGAWDIILSDYLLPQFSCEDALRVLRESGLEIPFIALSGTPGQATM
jgi:CheY-like chemotaxis protein